LFPCSYKENVAKEDAAFVPLVISSA